MHTDVTTLSGVLADAFKTLDEVEQRLAFTVDVHELGDLLCEVSLLTNRVDAFRARVADAAALNGVPQRHGQRTPAQFVAARSNASADSVRRSTRVAKWLRDYPVFESAYGTTLRTEHLDYLRKLDKGFDQHRLLVRDQGFFVETAAGCSFEGFVTACETWLIYNDPDGREPADQLKNNKFRIRKFVGGNSELVGDCDALTTQLLSTALEHESEKIRVADKEAGIDRTPGQRRMAALADLVARGFKREDGSYPVPLINIVMSQQVAEWAINALAGNNTGDHVPVHATNIDGRCELIDGTPIHPFLALFAFGSPSLATLSAPNLRRYVMSADSRPIDVSVNTRYAPEWMATAAQVETRGNCATHGCDAPHHWLQSDHVDPHSRGGETSLDNIEPQCRPDNQAKAATTGNTAWRNRPRPPHYQRRTTPRPASNKNSDDGDPDSPNN